MKPFVSELHDIGKLMDVESLRTSGQPSKRQTIHDIDFNVLGVSAPSSLSWWAVWSDVLEPEKSFNELECGATLEQKALILLSKIADGTAASVSRMEGRTLGTRGEGVYLLWRPSFFQQERQKGHDWAAFKNSDDLKRMLHYLDQCPSPSNFFTCFYDALRLTPEDKSPPGNFLPLRVHLELSGKIFRVVNQYVTLDQSNPNTPNLVYDYQSVSKLREAVGGLLNTKHESVVGKWIFRLVKCVVRFPQSIVRLQDLNVLELRRQKIREIVNGEALGGGLERQPYSVLFHTDDFLCLFLPKEKYLSLRDVLRPLLEKDFWVECEELEAELNLLTSTGERTRRQLQQKHQNDSSFGERYLKLRHIAIWPEIEQVFSPPLCDLCQQRQGQEYVKDQVREWLCRSCREIRELGEPAHIYAQWEEHSFPAAWFKISLDQKLALSCLQRLFEAYVDSGAGMNGVSLSDKQVLKEGFRPLAAHMEFVREYEEFLQEFRDSLTNLVGDDGGSLLTPGETLLFPIPGYLELALVRLDKSEILKAVLNTFVQRLRSRFPECVEDCPIRLSISVANPKYPYHEQWRFFSEPQQSSIALCIQEPGTRRIDVTIAQYTALRDKLLNERLSHFLHRLAAIEAQGGEITALVQALEQRHRFPQVHELMMFHRLSLRQILDFYQLVGSSTQ